ncbi:NmrA family NAD(P)-binding protein [Nonomuraea sp. NPDC050556]|uniref:NmrA family NAD(P)-binding protein n=1 Tax=Nonomuraea sp. NPDC050556 TaxID=3364369 RepID=UPI003792638F
MTILVTGATGTVGRQIVNELIRAGASVSALTRDPAKAALPEGVNVVAGDLSQIGTLDFTGVEALHLINFAGDDYSPLKNGQAIVDLAVEAGVKRVTVLGGRADGELEQALAASTLEWTLVNPVEFMSNTLMWWAQSIKTEGVIREPFGGRLSAMVHEGDIGAVIATVLTQSGHGGKDYTVTGPEALTTAEKVAVLAGAIGREIEFVELTPEQAVEKWKNDGMGEETIGFLLQALGNTPEIGYTVTSTVEDITGRPARSFAQWAAENASSFH